MIIGIDASRANVTDRTGTEWYSFYVIQHLKKIIPDNHQVVLYTKEELLPELGGLPQNWEVKVLKWPFNLLWTQLRLSIEMLFFKPDILYVPAHTLPIIHPKKVVTVIHDIGFEVDSTLYDQKVIGSDKSFFVKVLNFAIKVISKGKYSANEQDYHRFSLNLAIKNATKILTVSNFSKQEMVRILGLDEDQIVVASNGLKDEKKYSENTNVVLGKFNIKKPYILYIGRIEQKKNILSLVEAYAELKDKYKYQGQLVLCGKQGYQFNQIKERIQKLGLQNDVIMPGWTEEAELSIILREAQLFTLPSLYEGFGIPIIEAMQAGIPVVCSGISALNEVGAEAALYYDPRNISDISSKLNIGLTDKEVRDHLIDSGNARIKHFSWLKTAETTWRVLEDVLDK